MANNQEYDVKRRYQIVDNINNFLYYCSNDLKRGRSIYQPFTELYNLNKGFKLSKKCSVIEIHKNTNAVNLNMNMIEGRNISEITNLRDAFLKLLVGRGKFLVFDGISKVVFVSTIIAFIFDILQNRKQLKEVNKNILSYFIVIVCSTTTFFTNNYYYYRSRNRKDETIINYIENVSKKPLD